MSEPVLDEARIATLVEDIGKSGARDVLTIFFRDTIARLDLLSAIAGPSEIETIRRHAHTIKSAAAAFGFAGLSALARRLEAEAAALPIAEIKTLIAALSTATTTARALPQLPW